MRAHTFDKIGATVEGLRTGRFIPKFAQECKIQDKVSSSEHMAALITSMRQIQYSIEKALIKYAQQKNMMVALAYVKDLNTIHNLIWKYGQDAKKGK